MRQNYFYRYAQHNRRVGRAGIAGGQQNGRGTQSEGLPLQVPGTVLHRHLVLLLRQDNQHFAQGGGAGEQCGGVPEAHHAAAGRRPFPLRLQLPAIQDHFLRDNFGHRQSGGSAQHSLHLHLRLAGEPGHPRRPQGHHELPGEDHRSLGPQNEQNLIGRLTSQPPTQGREGQLLRWFPSRARRGQLERIAGGSTVAGAGWGEFKGEIEGKVVRKGGCEIEWGCDHMGEWLVGQLILGE